ncbi:hypothetical protein PA103_6088 [Pseudomonas aeruginosa PA103]|nr:hypothetical protein CSC41_2670 [Pseudomonas aeruginosa]EYT98670.1 hypothetical protein PA103_6088 [Pseudomonas aeruginosa PA103]RCG91181.1 hypothetical protein CSB89_1079 [Pseudomonas aeruginosa]
MHVVFLMAVRTVGGSAALLVGARGRVLARKRSNASRCLVDYSSPDVMRKRQRLSAARARARRH